MPKNVKVVEYVAPEDIPMPYGLHVSEFRGDESRRHNHLYIPSRDETVHVSNEQYEACTEYMLEHGEAVEPAIAPDPVVEPGELKPMTDEELSKAAEELGVVIPPEATADEARALVAEAIGKSTVAKQEGQ